MNPLFKRGYTLVFFDCLYTLIGRADVTNRLFASSTKIDLCAYNRCDSIDNVQRMETRIAVDLKVFRRRSGLRQADVAHLLGVHRTQVSKFERGVREPSIEHVTILCLIYGLRLPDFCVAARPQFERVLAERLQTLPVAKENTTETPREQTIQALTEQLADLPAMYDG